MGAGDEQRAIVPDFSQDDISIDVIVNNHNYGRFVSAAVDSALAQSHPNLHVIVVDDGSTDDSREILGAYGDKIELVLKPNGGQASALNAGFARSSADGVIFLDADDVLAPDAAARVAAVFATEPRVVKVQYRMQVIDEHGEPSGALKPFAHLPLPQGDVRREATTFPFDLVWLATSGNAFRAEALRRIMPIPEEDFRGCADRYLVHLVPLLGDVVSLQHVCAGYRVHGGNSYELPDSRLDLGHVRQSIAYVDSTKQALDTLIDELGLQRPYPRILSVSELANRLTSIRLEPELHPLPGDRRFRILADGLRATSRRTDVSWQMKALYDLWFLTAATLPRPLVRQLARILLFPQTRRSLNPFLGKLQRP
jgi:hypothetical protein